MFLKTKIRVCYALCCTGLSLSLLSACAVQEHKPAPELVTEAVAVALLAEMPGDESVFLPAEEALPFVNIDLQEIELTEIFSHRPMPVFDLWDRAREGFQLDLALQNKQIEAQRNWYARNQAYLDRVAGRAERYLFDVVEQLEQRDMPRELALLPIVESAYDPFAYSHGRASGMWQFIAATGERFSLNSDWWYDGRRDVVESTRGALDYLEYLYAMFDEDWLLALAAYNSGEGSVRRAIERNRGRGKPIDFWSLDLPRETQAYVPKLLALSQLLHEPDRHGIEFPPIPNRPYFERVEIGGQLDLAQAAELAQVPLDEIYLLNPGFNQWATSPDGPHFLNVPVDKAEVFKQNLGALEPEDRLSWLRYQIKSGDSLSTIARRHGTTAQVLRQINQLKSDNIRAGTTLFIPKASGAQDDYVLSAGQRLVAKQEAPADSGLQRQSYTIRSGDSFWTIARRFKVDMKQLAAWNGMAVRDPLRVGKTLIVWTKPAPTETLAALPAAQREVIRQVGYRVRTGDSLARIAQRFNVSIADIETWNEGISRAKHLQPGQRLTLYVDVTQARL